MIEKSIRIFCYSGLLVSLTALTLALGSYIFFKREINTGILTIVLLGTLSIYNVDHILGVESDKDVDRSRADFINSYRNALISTTIISLAVCGILGVTSISSKELFLLIPVFIVGLLHRRLKINRILSSIYITLSWIIVVILLPLSSGFPKGIKWYLLIVGLSLLANAYTYTGLDISYGRSSGNTLPVVALATSILLCFILPGQFIYLVFMPLLTLLSILFLQNKRQFKYLYLDGSLLAGSVLYLITTQL